MAAGNCVASAIKAGARKIVLEDLTHLRERIGASKRMRSRLHRLAWRQLQTFIECKAKVAGIASTTSTRLAYTSQTCSCCGA